MTLDRRAFLRKSGAGLILANLPGGLAWCSPSAAAAADAPFKTLSAEDGPLLAELAERLVPGARALGAAHFIDHHVGVPPADCLLTLRYLDVPPPYADFYRAGLGGLRRAMGTLKVTPRSTTQDWDALIGHMLAGTAPGWAGPPSALFYFVVRSDAVDVAYGTRDGFERLGVEYLAHIEPETDW